MTDQTAEITWRDHRTPVSTRFDDPYFSLHDGLAESRHVFLTGNRLPDRFTHGFHIAELGFGTGLNMLLAWQAYRETGLDGVLHFTSFEAYPMDRLHMKKALGGFPTLKQEADEFLENWPSDGGSVNLDGLNFTLITGDARKMVPNWQGLADAWFLDGFSPVKNPELWGKPLLDAVARHTGDGGSFATYTAAGHVRRNLADAGFTVERVAGFARKRHMTVGWL